MICEYASSATSGYRLRNSRIAPCRLHYSFALHTHPVRFLCHRQRGRDSPWSLTLARDKQENADINRTAAIEKQNAPYCTRSVFHGRSDWI